MQNLIVAAASNNNTPHAAFLQSIQSVQAYCNYMIGIATTQEPGLDNTLNICKNNSAQWYSTIYPEYLNMPSTILSMGSAIDSDFNLLIRNLVVILHGEGFD